MNPRTEIKKMFLPAPLRALPDGQEIVIEDASVLGYSNTRNVGRIRLDKDGISVNLFTGNMYKPLGYKKVKDIDEAVDMVVKFHKERSLQTSS